MIDVVVRIEFMILSIDVVPHHLLNFSLELRPLADELAFFVANTLHEPRETQTRLDGDIAFIVRWQRLAASGTCHAQVQTRRRRLVLVPGRRREVPRRPG